MPPCVCTITETSGNGHPVLDAIQEMARENSVEVLWYLQDNASIEDIVNKKEVKQRFIFFQLSKDVYYVPHMWHLMNGLAHRLNITMFPLLEDFDLLTPKMKCDSLKFIISDHLGPVVLFDPEKATRRLTRLTALLDA